MAKLRARISPVDKNSQVERYLTRDLGILSKKRLKYVKFTIVFLVISIILNIYQFIK